MYPAAKINFPFSHFQKKNQFSFILFLNFLKIATGLEAFTRNGISLDGFEIVDQGEECIYENPDGTSCDA